MEPDSQELAATLSRLAAVVLRERRLSDDLDRLTRLTYEIDRSAIAVTIALLVD